MKSNIDEIKKKLDAHPDQNNAFSNHVIPVTGGVLYGMYVTMKELVGDIEELLEERKQIAEAVKEITDLMCESNGVYGYHRNGDLSPWDEFDGVREKMERAMMILEPKNNLTHSVEDVRQLTKNLESAKKPVTGIDIKDKIK